MRHWHRCRRWTKRQMECPLRVVEGHDDMAQDSDERLEVKTGSRTGRALLRAPSLAPAATVKVREPRVVPATQRVGGGPLDEPGEAPPALEDIIATFIPALIEGLGDPPKRATFQEDDFPFLVKRGIVPFRVAKGVPRAMADASMMNQMTEEALAQVVREQAPAKADAVSRFPWFVLALPLLHELRKLIDLRPGRVRTLREPGPPRVIQPGEGGVHEPSRTSNRRADEARRNRIIRPNPQPAQVGRGFGGRHVDASTLLQGQVTKVRRHVRRISTDNPVQ